MRPLILLATLIAALPTAAQAQSSRAERALAGPRAVTIDPGPANLKIGGGTFIIRILPADQVRAACPAGPDWFSHACTMMPARLILMPDEESSRLTTAQWLDLLRHELLHASGYDFHGPERGR